ncbi:hypothetical protein AKJ63_02205 [candidate division MSBL1 archaeon SCGC-AAA259D18]|uniref:Uncharacterized protein n=1 Tax=candidate division MSBL1 archaeon SCGC-AAA259D18 TaxID=1698262 RepID=A0A133U9B5_9EURY|nr:hypothetical protein AKJ63_02205 [candidate division MSBL1 archaeon SCGC-AAA259D18]
MKKILPIIGLIFGIIIIVGFFSPWFSLKSNIHRTEGIRVEDFVNVTGWDLARGEIKVTQKESGTKDIHEIIHLKIEDKDYPFLDIIGGSLLLLGGVLAIISKRKFTYGIIIGGGIIASIGGWWGILANTWIRHRAISFGNYALFGYYRFGLLMCVFGGFVSILGTIIEAKMSRG